MMCMNEWGLYSFMDILLPNTIWFSFFKSRIQRYVHVYLLVIVIWHVSLHGILSIEYLAYDILYI